MILDILLILFLVFLNGFFVAAEFAIVKVRLSQLEAQTDPRKPNGRMARIIVRHLDAYLSATQLGITLASLGLGFVGEEVVAAMLIRVFGALGTGWPPDMAHNVALPVSFAIITVLHIVFGELAPKSLAIRHPLPTTLFVAMPMRLFYLVFRPFIWALNGFAAWVLKAIGVPPVHEAQGESHSEDELRLLVAESQRKGIINASEGELIERVFNFDDRIARQVMVPRTQIVGIDLEDGPEAAVEQMLAQRFTRVPLYRGSLDNIVGILYVKDLLRLLRSGQAQTVEDVMRPAVFVPGSKHVASLLREFQRVRYHMAIVTDEFGGTIGLLTIEDLVEEIVGQIYDEHDAHNPAPAYSRQDEYVVSAQTSIIDLNEFLPTELPESREYSTLAGLVLSVLRQFPSPGSVLTFGGYEITILACSRNRIESASLRLLPSADTDAAGESNPADDKPPEAG